MALESLGIILVILLVLLAAGVPISYAIGISSLAAILRIMYRLSLPPRGRLSA